MPLRNWWAVDQAILSILAIGISPPVKAAAANVGISTGLCNIPNLVSMSQNTKFACNLALILVQEHLLHPKTGSQTESVPRVPTFLQSTQPRPNGDMFKFASAHCYPIPGWVQWIAAQPIPRRLAQCQDPRRCPWVGNRGCSPIGDFMTKVKDYDGNNFGAVDGWLYQGQVGI